MRVPLVLAVLRGVGIGCKPRYVSLGLSFHVGGENVEHLGVSFRLRASAEALVSAEAEADADADADADAEA